MVIGSAMRTTDEFRKFGSQVAMQNSRARTDAELHPLREVPRWQWPDEAS
jgi:hemoglobin